MSTIISYNKSPEELKKIINKTADNVFKGFVDVPGYFCACDPVTGKDYFVVFYRHPDGTIEQVFSK